MIKYILFDFDGTLVDSRAVFISCFNKLAAKYHFHPITPFNTEELKKRSMLQRFKFLNVPFYKIPFLTTEFLNQYKKEILHLTFYPGIESLLKMLATRGIPMAIVSSNSVQTIKAFLQHKQVSGITGVYCSSRVFKKQQLLRRFLADHRLQPSDVLYVCDEWRDVNACEEVGIKTVWVDWGFESKEALDVAYNGYSINSPEELLPLL